MSLLLSGRRRASCWPRPSVAKLRLYLRLARPFTVLPPVLGIVSGSICAFGSLHNPDPARSLTHSVVFAVVLGSLCAGLMNAASNAVNQIYDREIDQLNKPHRPLVTRALSLREAWTFTGICYALALVPTWPVVPDPHRTWWERATAPPADHVTFFLYLAGLLFTFVYSVPGLGRTKKRGMLANATIAIPRGVLLKTAGWAIVAPVWHVEPWYIGGVLGLFLLGASSTKDFADIDGDRAGGCRTLPIVYGVRGAAWIISPFFVVPWLFIPVGAFVPDPASPEHAILTGDPLLLTAFGVLFMGWGAYTAYLLLRDPRSLAATENHPAWKHMYLMMMGAQVAFVLAYLFDVA